ncbi:ASKHA domain-containing protein [Ruminococcaceae bacterium OttesenSCG-928-I18]|nr:ASKHA domain-containing protein [Ruminococcaceae bacterium OttesenSCG-928-I18]
MGDFSLDAGCEFQPLHELMRKAEIDIGIPCAGNHTCGKCRVLVQGQTDEVGVAEACLLTKEDIRNGVRLACFCKVRGAITLTLPGKGPERILTNGVKAVAPGHPMMEPGFYGAAIDIGTTTVACYLFDSTGNLVDSISEMNRQRRFGADVISRIQYCIQNGRADVHEAIVRQLEKMLDRLAGKAGIPRGDIRAAVVTGNTIMLHLFANLDPEGMGSLPFTPESLFDWESEKLLRGVRTYLPPCVSAYVGADLLCCVLTSESYHRDGLSCVVDIGTNGEMALCNRGVLSCCSTAAGPAFEGAGISCGMMAAEGAISHVQPVENGYRWQTIGNTEPRGVCGSGVVDTVNALLRTGALLPSGRLCEAQPYVERLENKSTLAFRYPGTDLSFTQEDVRQLQLAKAAIYGGMQTLLADGKVRFEDLDVLYLCGGFGSYLDLHSAEGIGLIPKGTADKTVVLGNGAAAGAARILMSRAQRDTLRQLRDNCRYIELSADETFMEYYVEAMSF